MAQDSDYRDDVDSCLHPLHLPSDRGCVANKGTATANAYLRLGWLFSRLSDEQMQSADSSVKKLKVVGPFPKNLSRYPRTHRQAFRHLRGPAVPYRA